MRKICLFLLMTAFCGALWASPNQPQVDFIDNGIRYNITSVYTVRVTGEGENNYSGDVVIPETVEYDGTVYSVTGIGQEAFTKSKDLLSVKIPDSVTEIEGSAFFQCTSLTSVTIPSSVTIIEDKAFLGCPVTHYICDNEEYLSLFSGEDLKEVIIGNSVTSIGDYAFNRCHSLSSVEIPNSVTTICEAAFRECTSLTALDIPNSVTSIGSSAFDGCLGLESVHIPSSITSIGDYAFYACSNLTSADISDTVTEVGTHVFVGCPKLTKIIYNNKYFIHLPTPFSGEYSIPDGIAIIAGGAFYHCENLTHVDIPESVIKIGDNAFDMCLGLTSVVIPSSVTEIDFAAFGRCRNLMEITSLNPEPPTLGAFAFTDVPIEKCVLKVPTEAIEAYKTTYDWKDFKRIFSTDPNKINHAAVAPDSGTAYNLKGQPVGDSFRGIVIRDGKKTLVK